MAYLKTEIKAYSALSYIQNYLSAHQLHDLDMKVGNSTRNMLLCGHFSGYTTVGGRMAVFCPTPTVRRYVQVQIFKGDSNYMSPAEVLVWGRKFRYH